MARRIKRDLDLDRVHRFLQQVFGSEMMLPGPNSRTAQQVLEKLREKNRARIR